MLFEYSEKEALGSVYEVDTTRVLVRVSTPEKLRNLRVGRLTALHGKPGEHLIGLVEKVIRRSKSSEVELAENDKCNESEALEGVLDTEENIARIVLIGTFRDKDGSRSNVFSRSLMSVPDIDAKCYPIEGEYLSTFMSVISSGEATDSKKLQMGKYSLDETATVFLDGNRFFQRHAAILGSTGCGKSWTVAKLVEQVGALPYPDLILFDLHGEYGTLDWATQLKVAGPADLGKETLDILYLPYWLANYEEILSMFLDRSDQNAPNQAMAFSQEIITAKRSYLENKKADDVLAHFTINSPVPYSLQDVVTRIDYLNTEMVPGVRGEKKGPFNGEFDRFLPRLQAKISDRRYGFLFQAPPSTMAYDWFTKLANQLLCPVESTDKKSPGVKVIDFSEVPSDILPVIVGLVARLVFQLQFWMEEESRHPVAIICDEAHLYLPSRPDRSSVEQKALDNFERIAKEGRKYGISLVVVSQRPSDVSKTILSQCNNVVAMRLTNAEDQMVVSKLMPDSLSGLIEMLPILGTGEAIVVGDSVLLPSRIKVDPPIYKPSSGTVPFWDEWSRNDLANGISVAVENMRKQSK